MMHDIAIWKLVVGGCLLLAIGFILGFFIALACVVAGEAEAAERKVIEDGYQLEDYTDDFRKET